MFRSEGQGRLLARVYLGADRPAPIADLARELGLDAGGLTREADRLERAGLVASDRIGRQRLLRPNVDSPYYASLHSLLLTAFGPAAVVGPEFGSIPGVERLFIFGSWAARYRGMPGPDPADVDVMVIGSPERRAVASAAGRLSDLMHREVNPTIVSSERWDSGDDVFIRQVKANPLIEIGPAAPSGDE